MPSDYFVADELEASVKLGFLGTASSSHLHGSGMQPKLIDNSDGRTMVATLLHEFEAASTFEISVAFVTTPGLDLIREVLTRGGKTHTVRGTIVTSDYLGFNSPDVFLDLLSLRDYGIRTMIYRGAGYHPKGYLFHRAGGVTAVLGSSNLTTTALTKNLEWNLRVSALAGSTLSDELAKGFERQLNMAQELSADWVAGYRETWIPPVRGSRSGPIVEAAMDAALEGMLAADEEPGVAGPGGRTIEPNAMQVDALSKIAAVRAAGEPRALVISATGTGKTILSALDVRAMAPKRLLFVAHREQILKKSLEAYRAVLEGDSNDFGLLSGSVKQHDRRYVFATIQTLTQMTAAGDIARDAFEYIVIDEAHRAGAQSFKTVLDYFEPDFCLGMTATPDRTDGENIYALFNHQVPYTIRLAEALEQEMLAPFRYYGVTDYVTEDGATIDVDAPLGRLVDGSRIDHVLTEIERRVSAARPVRGLVFCSRNDEAREVAEQLNARRLFGRPLRAKSLSGGDSQDVREGAVRALENGDLDYLVTVDIFNEGIDIPSVNQVVMLRQTQSPIVFLQQLGRGLRKSPGKDSVTVIDFIGNYVNNFMIPIALLGNNTLNKDSIRKALAAVLEDGTLHHLSTVHFDEISRARVLESLTMAKLSGMKNLREQYSILEQRLGRTPRLMDFVENDTVDPMLIASSQGNFAMFRKAMKAPVTLSPRQLEVLTFLTAEGLQAKREHELVVLRLLVRSTQPVSRREIENAFEHEGLFVDSTTIDGVIRVLTGGFSIQQEREKYGAPVVLQAPSGCLSLSDEFKAWLADSEFIDDLEDILETGLAVIRERYSRDSVFTLGRQYSRKDACRLLNWPSNQAGVVNGYKIDHESQTCPIFVTHRKDEDVSASTAYEDEIVDPQHMIWYSRSNRKLSSAEIMSVLDERIAKYMFIRKDGADGADFYFTGRAVPSNARQETMRDDQGKTIPVVAMDMELEAAIPRDVLAHLEPAAIR